MEAKNDITKKQRGGSRKGAGRKNVEDKATQLCLYPLKSRIELIGKNKIKNMCMKTIEEKYAELKRIANEINSGERKLEEDKKQLVEEVKTDCDLLNVCIKCGEE